MKVHLQFGLNKGVHRNNKDPFNPTRADLDIKHNIMTRFLFYKKAFR